MSTNETHVKMLLAGEGGQGIQTIAKALGEAAAKSGKEVAYIPVFGVEQRGTPSISFVTVSSSPIYYPRFDVADIVVVLRSRAIPRVEKYISPNSKILIDSSTVSPKYFSKKAVHIYGIPATKIASEHYHPKSFNMIILGVLAKQIGIDPNLAWEMAAENLGAKLSDASVKKMNHDAFLYGYEATLEHKEFSKPVYETKKSKNIFKNSEKTGEVNPALCKGCGICIEKCPVKALSYGEDLGYFALPVPTIDLEKCIVCGNCRRFCPDSAIGVSKNVK